MFITILFLVVGILVFLFLFWKRLREDYASEFIFSTGFLTILAMFAILYIGNRFYQEWWFWFSLLGVTIGLSAGVLLFKLRIFEVVEAATMGLLPWFALTFMADSIRFSSLLSLGGTLVALSFFVLLLFFNAHYKSFSWYRSGRVGFSGLTTLGLFFLMRASVAITFPHVLSFVGKADSLVSAVFAFICFLGVYNLSKEG